MILNSRNNSKYNEINKNDSLVKTQGNSRVTFPWKRSQFDKRNTVMLNPLYPPENPIILLSFSKFVVKNILCMLESISTVQYAAVIFTLFSK